MQRVRFKYDVNELFNKCGIELSDEPQEILLEGEEYFGVDVSVDKKGNVVFTKDGLIGIGVENGIRMDARTFLIELKKQIKSFIPKHEGKQFPVTFDEELQEVFDQFRADMSGVYAYIVGANEMEYFSVNEYRDLCNYRADANHAFKEAYCIRDFDEHIEHMHEIGFETYGEIMNETNKSGKYCIVGDRVVEFRKGKGKKTGILKMTMFGNIGGVISEMEL